MIRISCTNCKTILSIDDAFAGGVCRCQHCGTIQTVPAKARDGAAVGVSGQSIGGAKAYYQNGDAPSGTGLDELAGIVVSSGLSSSRLTRGNRKPETKPAKSFLLPALVASGVIVIVLVFVIIYLATRNNASATAGRLPNEPGMRTDAVAVTNSPNFCGMPVTGNTVIYLLDCGVATQDYLGDLKDATLKSIATLGSNRKFQIRFWNNGTDSAYPESGTAYATQESINAAKTAIEDMAGFGQSDIKPALTLALAQHPDVIIIATGKGWDLDTAWLDSVRALRGSSPVKIDAFNLTTSGESAPLKKLAASTGGQYRDLGKNDLRNFAQ